MFWNGHEEDENVRSVRKMKALNLKMEMVAMIGKGKYNLRCCVY